MSQMDYTTKSYGRNDEVATIYKLFDAGVDISMPGPRRLGKTFLLDRLVDAGPMRGWHAVKIEVAGCKDARGFFRQLCAKIGSERSGKTQTISWLSQRLGQAIDPRTDAQGAWYQAFISMDHETYFERLIKALHDDKKGRWALLIDELPIFLKALHDQGATGVETARNFMNQLSRMRVDYPNVRWLITGSIGMEPLAKAGNYMGVLAKFETYTLSTLEEDHACDFVIDLAQTGRLVDRSVITTEEAKSIVREVGWRSAFYLEALAKKLTGLPAHSAAQADQLVINAMEKLLQPAELPTFAVWEEHLRKHYAEQERVAVAVLTALAQHPQGLSLDALLAAINQPAFSKDTLRNLLMRLDVEGFVSVDNWDAASPSAAFRNVLLRRWWQRFPPVG
ncbi:MAG: hypothetical protein ACK46J_15895 [Burkholderiales bacterium]|jgi:hypothetical protein